MDRKKETKENIRVILSTCHELQSQLILESLNDNLVLMTIQTLSCPLVWNSEAEIYLA